MLVHSLDGPNGPVNYAPGMVEISTSFYQDLFRKSESTGCTLANGFFSHEENIPDA
jgi:hypothetical protein